MIGVAFVVVVGLLVSRKSIGVLRRPYSDTPHSRWWRALASVTFWLLLGAWFMLASKVTTAGPELALFLGAFALPATAFVASCWHSRSERHQDAVLRAGAGLPPRRNLVPVWQIGVAWFALYISAEFGAFFVQSEHSRQVAGALDVRPMYAVVCFTVGLGVLHAAVQHYRIKAETARTAEADRKAARAGKRRRRPTGKSSNR